MDLLHLFNAGGLMMYPLLLCSVIVVAIFVERIRFYRANGSEVESLSKEIPQYMMNGDREGLIAYLKSDGGIPAHVILQAAHALGRRGNQETLVESAAMHASGELKNYLTYLDVIVTLSPLMGLLGTVIGMISSFNVLAVADGQPFAVTGGVAEALVCTAMGLFVAILALIVYTYLSNRVNQFISDIEKISSVYLSMVEGGRS